MYIVIGTTETGEELYATGKPAAEWVSKAMRDATRHDRLSRAETVADRLNAFTDVHGVTFRAALDSDLASHVVRVQGFDATAIVSAMRDGSYRLHWVGGSCSDGSEESWFTTLMEALQCVTDSMVELETEEG